MTASEIATLLRAKRVRKGAWFAKCPVHHEDTASLSIRDMGNRMSIKCFGCGAGAREVLKAMGLQASDMFVDKQTMNAELRAVLADEYRMEKLRDAILECIRNQYFVEPERKGHWRTEEDRAWEELEALRDKLNPERKEMLERKARYDRFIAKWGHDALWQSFLASPKGQGIAEQYEVKPKALAAKAGV